MAKYAVPGCLECSLCLDIQTSPKLLQCGHSFCCHCLKDLIAAEEHLIPNVSQFACPTCRSIQIISSPGIAGIDALVNNHQLVQMIDYYQEQKLAKEVQVSNKQTPISTQPKHHNCTVCQQDVKAVVFCMTCNRRLCECCQQSHDSATHRHNHVMVKFDEANLSNITCKTHTNECVTVFCWSCMQSICQVCSLKDHNDHKLIPFAKAKSGDPVLDDMTKQLNMLLKELNDSKDMIQAARKDNDKKYSDVKHQSLEILNNWIEMLKEQQNQCVVKADEYHSKIKLCLDAVENKTDEATSRVKVQLRRMATASEPLGSSNAVKVDDDTLATSFLTDCKRIRIPKCDTNMIKYQMIENPQKSNLQLVSMDVGKVPETTYEMPSPFITKEQLVLLEPGCLRLLNRFFREDLDKIQDTFKNFLVDIKPSYSPLKPGFTVRGTTQGLQSAVSALRQKASQVLQREYVITRPGLTRLLNTTSGDDYLEMFQLKHHVICDLVDYDKAVTSSGRRLHSAARYSANTGYLPTKYSGHDEATKSLRSTDHTVSLRIYSMSMDTIHTVIEKLETFL